MHRQIKSSYLQVLTRIFENTSPSYERRTKKTQNLMSVRDSLPTEKEPNGTGSDIRYESRAWPSAELLISGCLPATHGKSAPSVLLWIRRSHATGSVTVNARQHTGILAS